MNPATLTARREKALVLLIAASFALPLILGVLLLIPRTDVPGTAWLRNTNVQMRQAPPSKAIFSRAALLSAKYQAALAENYNFRFSGRELMIRLINELYLRLFHAAPADILVGPHYSLTSRPYADEYCLARTSPDALRPLVENLRRMQDFCDARGIAFALMITPSKSAIYPESLPAIWLRRHRPEPRGYDQFLPLLREKGIRYVDGHRITADLKPTAEVPLFPLGGAHWGEPAALATTNALLATLASRGLNVQPIRVARTSVSDHPTGQEYELFNLINIVSTIHFPVVSVSVQPAPPGNAYHPNIVFVGGSFTWKPLELIDNSRQCSELEMYFYYTKGKRCRANGELYLITAPTQPLNFETDIFAADALVLEVNEEVLYGSIIGVAEVAHLKTFLRDAFAVLPDPHAPKARFHYEVQMDYRWGETISFVGGNPILNQHATSGFTGPSAGGSFTVGPVATIQLNAPIPTEDVVLEMEAGAFLVDTRMPEQRVSVYANGHAVGEWLWRAGTPPHHEMVIPKDFLSGGKIELAFHIARPSSPLEFGVGKDANKYGILVSSLRLSAPTK